MKLLNLISGPRNISTALMYSFAQRDDTTVVDEPFYAFYLAKTGVNHPGKDEVLRTQSSDEFVVLNEILAMTSKPVLFVKNMAHHLEVMKSDLLDRAVNIFLIRNPKQIIASYAEVIEKPVMRDIGIKYQFELFKKLAATKSTPVVIDSGSVVEDPASVLRKLCDNIGIGFQEKMLTWKSGPKKYDGVWAPYWYTNVHKSTGFEKQPMSTRELPVALKPIYEEACVYYEKLLAHAVRP